MMPTEVSTTNELKRRPSPKLEVAQPETLVKAQTTTREKVVIDEQDKYSNVPCTD